jgi:plastocyanin
VFDHAWLRRGVDRRPLARWSRRLAVLAALSLAALALTTTASGATSKIVRTQGNETFVPNSKVMATLKFTPGHLVVRSGDTLTLQHSDKSDEPHTLSIVNADEVPSTAEQVFGCGEPGTVCDEVFHLFPQEPTTATFANGPGTGPGIDGRLDTLVVFPGESISEPVTAPAGTTLSFICAIHPWMQGTIDVH